MARIETWFNQDLQKPVKVQYLDGNVFSADNSGNLIGVKVFNNGLPASLSGIVSANIIRADGVTVSTTGSLSGNKASVILPQSAYIVPGPISVIIKLTENSVVTTLCAVVSNVYMSETDSIVDPGTIIPSIEALIAAIEEAIASVPADYSALQAIVGGIGASVGEYVPKVKMIAEDGVNSIVIDMKETMFKRRLRIIDSGSGGYYGYALYLNGSKVFGTGVDDNEQSLFWIAAGSTYEIEIPSTIVADTLLYRNRNGRSGTTIEIVSDAAYPEYVFFQGPYHYLRRIGIEPVAVGEDAEGDATVNTSTHTFTVPQGKTGYNSYFTIQFSWAEIASYDYSSQEAVLTVALKCSTNPERLNLAMFSARVPTATRSKLISKYGSDVYVYEIRYSMPQAFDGTSNEYVYIQMKNTEAVSSAITLQYISASLEWEGRDRVIAGDHDLIMFQSAYHYLRRIGIQPVGVGENAQSGATVDTTTHTITIPEGQTGNNSYFTIAFSFAEIIRYAYSSQEAALIVALRCNKNPDMLKPLIWYDTTGVGNSQSKIIGKLGQDVYLYEIRFAFPASLSQEHNEIIYIQFKNTSTFDTDVSVRYVDCSLEWEGLDRSIIGGMKNAAEQTPNETIITVGTGKQYTSLRTALEHAANIANSTNHVTVQYFGNGIEYNVMNDITTADLQTSSTWPGLSVPAYCKLLGMGSREQNKISLTLPEGTDEDVAFRISTVNLYENAELENLWFYGKRCRYACHDDMMQPNPTWKLKTIKNCRFTSDYTNQHRAYGAGYRSGVYWRFENCIFENINGEQTQYGNAAFSAHNNDSMRKAASITFVNCQASGGHGFGFESLNRTAAGQDYPNAKTMISFYGCKAMNYVWDRPVQASIPAADADLEVCLTGFANNFDNSGVAVYYGGDYYNDRFPDQLTLWGKITN